MQMQQDNNTPAAHGAAHTLYHSGLNYHTAAPRHGTHVTAIHAFLQQLPRNSPSTPPPARTEFNSNRAKNVEGKRKNKSCTPLTYCSRLS